MKIMCVIEICKGYCCEHIDFEMAKKLRKYVGMIENPDGSFRCKVHDKRNGKCLIYEDRPLICKQWFCDSALRGFMENASKYIKDSERL
jgi:Fe-S-cluster containining protein